MYCYSSGNFLWQFVAKYKFETVQQIIELNYFIGVVKNAIILYLKYKVKSFSTTDILFEVLKHWELVASKIIYENFLY